MTIKIEDPQGCGMGQANDCCIWLVMHPSVGFCCDRENVIMQATMMPERRARMIAQRDPVEPIPNCQIFL